MIEVNVDLLKTDTSYVVYLIAQSAESEQEVRNVLKSLGFEYRRPSESYYHPEHHITINEEVIEEAWSKRNTTIQTTVDVHHDPNDPAVMTGVTVLSRKEKT